jgi:pyrroline-5-carboxylate reductase
MASQFKLGFIGGGNMANALIAGLLNQQFDPKNIQVVELDAVKRQQLSTQYGVATTDSLTDIAKNEVIILAIKPQQLKALAIALAPHLSQQLVISIAAGIRLADLSRWLNQYQHLVRAMPNTPAQIQAGITGLFAQATVSETHRAMATQVLAAAGQTLWLEQERDLDAVTAISGSGPAYVFYLIEALEQAAIELGLSPEQAKRLSISTFTGASLLAQSSNTPVDKLREQVTSKGGTTEQGLISLEQSRVKQAIQLAAQQAAKRATTLADELGSQ